MSDDETDKTPKRRRGPKKATAKYLENSAAHYLGRFATSRAHLRQLMMQKVKRSADHHGTDPAEGEKFVDDIIAKFERYGFLDDKAYAEMRARSLHAKGTPVRGIRYKLMQKGLEEEYIDAALDHLADEERAANLDLAAALTLARRRRIGPYRTDDKEARDERREKDMAILARAGFSYDVVCQVLDADSVEELELAARDG
ncbi:MAG: RecX family transcriptional regulator [Rhodospirillales bacterium]|nr:RecX family transcriptional regulator [Rhodospirillales bacterium]